MFDIETIIIGAGVVGLAIARDLAITGHDVLIIEQHGLIGSETSSRNSEVIHAGIYYPGDSLKALLCVEGKQRLYAFCESHHVPHKRLGKLIVAADPSQIAALEQIARRAAQNDVTDLEFLDAGELAQMEPELTGAAALFSPSTGIIDSHAFMLALQGDAELHGAQIAFNSAVGNIAALPDGGFRIDMEGDAPFSVTCRNAIVSAGLHSSRLLRGSGLALTNCVPQMHYAKGNYFRFSGRVPFSHLIYPVPDAGGLGVHLTLDMGGQARFGPDVEWIDELNYDVDPQRGEQFYASIRSYWPGLPDASLDPDYAGIRPKISARGETNADFLILGPSAHGHAGLIALAGIESPGLTASLAIADRVRRLLA